MLWTKPGIHGNQPREAAQHQSRARAKHQRQRNLRHYKAPPQRLMSAHAAAHRALLHRVLQVHARDAQRRRQPEQHCGQQGSQQREQQHASVYGNRLASRQRRIRRNQRQQSTQSVVREQQSSSHPCHRQQRAFDQQLLNDARPRRPQRRTHGHFPQPSRSPHQQQVRHVRARDQQQKSYRRQQHPQRTPYLFRRVFQHREDGRAPVLVHVRARLLRIIGHPQHVLPRLLQRHSRF